MLQHPRQEAAGTPGVEVTVLKVAEVQAAVVAVLEVAEVQAAVVAVLEVA